MVTSIDDVGSKKTTEYSIVIVCAVFNNHKRATSRAIRLQLEQTIRIKPWLYSHWFPRPRFWWASFS